MLGLVSVDCCNNSKIAKKYFQHTQKPKASSQTRTAAKDCIPCNKFIELVISDSNDSKVKILKKKSFKVKIWILPRTTLERLLPVQYG